MSIILHHFFGTVSVALLINLGVEIIWHPLQMNFYVFSVSFVNMRKSAREATGSNGKQWEATGSSGKQREGV